MAKVTQGAVSVEIEAPDNNTAYDEETFLREEERLRSQIAAYLATGARPDNLAEAVAQVLDEELGS